MLVVEHQAQLDIQNWEGWVPMIWAIVRGHIAIVKFLAQRVRYLPDAPDGGTRNGRHAHGVLTMCMDSLQLRAHHMPRHFQHLPLTIQYHQKLCCSQVGDEPLDTCRAPASNGQPFWDGRRSILPQCKAIWHWWIGCWKKAQMPWPQGRTAACLAIVQLMPKYGRCCSNQVRIKLVGRYLDVGCRRPFSERILGCWSRSPHADS
jgi:hypothetical protein